MSDPDPTVTSMDTVIDSFTHQLASVSDDIARADGQVSVTLLGPSLCGHGPSADGQLCVEIWNSTDDEPDQYYLQLHRDAAVDPDYFLLTAARTFVVWLDEHGVVDDELPEEVSLPMHDQLVLGATFEAENWRVEAASTH